MTRPALRCQAQLQARESGEAHTVQSPASDWPDHQVRHLLGHDSVPPAKLPSNQLCRVPHQRLMHPALLRSLTVPKPRAGSLRQPTTGDLEGNHLELPLWKMLAVNLKMSRHTSNPACNYHDYSSKQKQAATATIMIRERKAPKGEEKHPTQKTPLCKYPYVFYQIALQNVQNEVTTPPVPIQIHFFTPILRHQA